MANYSIGTNNVFKPLWWSCGMPPPLPAFRVSAPRRARTFTKESAHRLGLTSRTQNVTSVVDDDKAKGEAAAAVHTLNEEVARPTSSEAAAYLPPAASAPSAQLVTATEDARLPAPPSDSGCSSSANGSRGLCSSAPALLCPEGTRRPGCTQRCCIKPRRTVDSEDEDENEDEQRPSKRPKATSVHWGHKRQATAVGLGIALASDYSKSGIDSLRGFVALEKYDGVRATWEVAGSKPHFRTRNGNEVTPPPSFAALMPTDMRLDGELWLGRGRFQQTWPSVMHAQEATWAEVRYMVFDAPAAGGGGFNYAQRLEAAQRRLGPGGGFGEALAAARVQVAGTTPCEDTQRMASLLKGIIDGGGEGLILRSAESKFHAGRSDDLLKVKPWYDADARVVGYRLGGKDSLRCRSVETSVVFDVTCVDGVSSACLSTPRMPPAPGSSLALPLLCPCCSPTDRVCLRSNPAHNNRWDRRERPPPAGTLITYRYQLGLQRNQPRFPQFMRVRNDDAQDQAAVQEAWAQERARKKRTKGGI